MFRDVGGFDCAHLHQGRSIVIHVTDADAFVATCVEMGFQFPFMLSRPSGAVAVTVVVAVD